MARNLIIPENPPRVPTPTSEETPHVCWDGWVFLGYEGVDEDGELIEVGTERVPCRRCNVANESL